MAGLLTALLGAAKPTSFGTLLGENYNPEDERAARLSGFLSNAGQALLNPQRHLGDIGQIGTAINKGMAGSKENRTSYLQEAMSRKLAADRLEATKREQEDRDRQDAAKADFIAEHPEYRTFIEMYPKEFGEFWQKYMLGEKDLLPGQKGGVDGGSWGKAPYRLRDTKGNIFYRSFNDNGETKITPEIPGTVPVGQLKMIETLEGQLAVDPYTGQPIQPPIPGSRPGDIKQAEAEGADTGKAIALRKAAAPSVEYASNAAKSSIKDILADPNMNYYTDYYGKFGDKIFSTPEFIGFEAKIQPLLSAQFKAFMDQSGVHSQISDKDREAMQALIASIKPGMPRAQLIQALTKIDDFFTNVLTQNRKYLIEGDGEEVWDAEGNRIQ